MNLLMDPYLLLSIVNTKLRDIYNDLESLCDDLNIDQKELNERLLKINYIYDENKKAFVANVN